MATAIVTSFWPINDSNGDPVSGAKIYVYDATTTTPRAIYSDTGLSASVSNPIICNSAGRTTTDGGTTVGLVYTAAGSYKIVVKTSADVTLYTLDNIDGGIPVGSGALAIANGGTAATTAETALANLGGASASDLADLAADVAAVTSGQTLTAGDGTASQPSYTFADDSNTGLFRETTDNPAMSAGGTKVQEWTSTGSVVTGTLETTGQLTVTSIAGGVMATQSNMEAASSDSTVVSPARQHWHPGHGKFWLKAAGAGTLTSSYNITSVTDTGPGVLTVTIATDFSSADYAITTGYVLGTVYVHASSQAAGSFVLNSQRLSDGAALDPTTYYAAGFGDQA